MRTKSEIVEFVMEKMIQKKLTKSRLGQALGASGGAQAKVQRANGFLSPKSQKINMADLFLVSQFLEIDPKEVLFANTKNKEFGDTPQGSINPNHLVPLISHGVTEDKNDFFQEWLIYPYDNSAYKKIVAIPMPDNRMEPLIKKGEILFVDNRLYSFSLSDRLILATYANQFIVGRFRRLENDQVQIYFEDPSADPAVYSTNNEHLEIMGVVISRFCETT